MTERMIAFDGVEVCAEAFGSADDEPVLLIMGRMASMLWWPDGLCERLAGARRFAIRYDNRDTGRSTSYPPGRPTYTFDDMVDDAVAVLDGYGIERAHVVGMSMGGAIAQLVALDHPDRVSALTAISTSPLGTADDLPGPSQAYAEYAAALGPVDWSDRDALAEMLIAESRVLAGTAHPFDEQAVREHVARDLARTRRPASLRNHELLGGETREIRLQEIAVPVTVVHGTADPLFPLAHGEALARAIPGARLVPLEGGGHELHPADWDRIVAAITS